MNGLFDILIVDQDRRCNENLPYTIGSIHELDTANRNKPFFILEFNLFADSLLKKHTYYYLNL